MSKDDAEKMLAEFRVSRLQIPKIKAKDPALLGTGAKGGPSRGNNTPRRLEYIQALVE